MDQRITDDLTAAIAAWVTAAMAQGELDEEKRNALAMCLQADGADIQVVARLREGALVLECTANGRFIEIFRQDVEPLRSLDHFGHQAGEFTRQ